MSSAAVAPAVSVISNITGGAKGGGNSILNNPGQIWGGQNSVFNQAGYMLGISHPPGGAPQPQAIPAAPTTNDATQVALNTQLQKEVQMRASQTLFTGGSGMLDQPTPASRVLLGGS